MTKRAVQLGAVISWEQPPEPWGDDRLVIQREDGEAVISHASEIHVRPTGPRGLAPGAHRLEGGEGPRLAAAVVAAIDDPLA